MKRKYSTEDEQTSKSNARSRERKEFLINPKQKFDTKFPYLRKPSEIGCISLNRERKFSPCRKQMVYYKQPENPNNVSFDLTIGYKDYIRRDENKKEYINDILKWIKKNPDVFQLKDSTLAKDQSDKGVNLHTDFICWRGLLTRLLSTPYENREGWKIAITRYNNTYYMCEFDTDQKIEFVKNKSQRMDEMCYWGWKFEQYVTSAENNGRTDTTKKVNTNEAFCTVVRSRLNNHSLVYSGEVDAANPDNSTPANHTYVEFKTSLEIHNNRQDRNFKRFKLIKWWAQSFLVAIESIICGFRDDHGVVHRLEKFVTNRIPDIVKDIGDPWHPNVCFNFLDQLLTFIKQTVTEDDHRVVYLLQWNPYEDVTCDRLESDSKYCFLPRWYIDDLDIPDMDERCTKI